MADAWIDTSRHNGKTNGSRIAGRGTKGIVARCTIGFAPRDEQYLATKKQAKDNDLAFAAYGVNWPINRNPRGEAEWFVKNLTDPTSPDLPLFVVGDFELGTRKHDSGHHNISGEELVEQAIIWCEVVESESGLVVLFYTARWHWNDPKMLPYIDAGEKEFKLFAANYPYDKRQLKGFPPRYTADVLSPDDIGSAKPITVEPWDMRPVSEGGDLAAWQWTSKIAGIKNGYVESTFLDGDEFYFSPLDPGPTPQPDPKPQQLRDIAAGLKTDAADLEHIANELEN